MPAEGFEPPPPVYKMGKWESSKCGRNQRVVFTEVFFAKREFRVAPVAFVTTEHYEVGPAPTST